jgi:hypothetical protein
VDSGLWILSRFLRATAEFSSVADFFKAGRRLDSGLWILSRIQREENSAGSILLALKSALPPAENLKIRS